MSKKVECSVDDVYMSVKLLEKVDKSLVRMLVYLWNTYKDEYDRLVFKLSPEEKHQCFTIYAGHKVISTDVYKEHTPITIEVEISSCEGYTIMKEN